MGAYLSQPITEKVSSDEYNNKLVCGASSMQGWRANQEDAHNTILDYDTNTALFAVYDGHGGAEVALYSAQKLPNYIKETEAYKEGNLTKALEDAFLGFDATISTQEVMELLKVMAGETNTSGQVNEMDDGSDDENVNTLYSDARLPLKDVLAQYENKLAGIHRARLESTTPLSPCLRAKKNEEAGGSGAGASSSSNDAAAGSSSEPDLIEASSSKNGVSNEAEGKAEEDTGGVSSTNNDKDTNGVVSTSEPEVAQTSSMEVEKPTSSAPDSSGDNANEPEQSADAKASTGSKDASNGEVTESKQVGADGDISSSNGGAASPTKGKEKASSVSSSDKPVPNRPKKSQIRRAAAAVYESILRQVADDDDEESDSNDENFEGEEASSDDENVNGAAEEKGTEEVEVEPNDDNANYSVGNIVANQERANAEEEDDVEDDDDDDNDDDDDDEPSSTDEEEGEDIGMQEEPGNDSGCTAVVALLRGNELYVANAGDSRCIICREGKAVDMSIDHKPEDESELDRITKAGGKVSTDGRVNGGLNLSRAIGDHSYKLNKELGPREQMITALPDVKTLSIDTATDQFMVLACDGIWNYMSSQDVCDFIVPRLAEGREKLSQICEEMFDHCLAPSTMGDGTGCDNMTAIIVKFKDGAIAEVGSATTEGPKKRAAEEEPSQDEQQDSKRQKVDDPLSSSQVTSSV